MKRLKKDILRDNQLSNSFSTDDATFSTSYSTDNSTPSTSSTGDCITSFSDACIYGVGTVAVLAIGLVFVFISTRFFLHITRDLLVPPVNNTAGSS